MITGVSNSFLQHAITKKRSNLSFIKLNQHWIVRQKRFSATTGSNSSTAITHFNNKNALQLPMLSQQCNYITDNFNNYNQPFLFI